MPWPSLPQTQPLHGFLRTAPLRVSKRGVWGVIDSLQSRLLGPALMPLTPVVHDLVGSGRSPSLFAQPPTHVSPSPTATTFHLALDDGTAIGNLCLKAHVVGITTVMADRAKWENVPYW